MASEDTGGDESSSFSLVPLPSEAMASEYTSGDESSRWLGCHFTPTDEELVDYCLLNKVRNLPLRIPPGYSIPEMEVYKKPPWELVVRSSYLPTGVFYCFVRVPRSNARDNRLKRKTRGGSWVANGKPRDIPHQGRRTAIAGTRRSLKFFKDSDDPRKKNKKDSSLGQNWIMHEYRLHPSLYETIPSYETEEMILCRIQHKGRGAADKSDGDSSLPAMALPCEADTQETPEPLMAVPSTQSMAIDNDNFDFLDGLDIDLNLFDIDFNLFDLDFDITRDPGCDG